MRSRSRSPGAAPPRQPSERTNVQHAIGPAAATKMPLTCAACRVIDQADGVEDGKLFKVEHYQTRNERTLLDGILQAQAGAQRATPHLDSGPAYE